MKNEEDEPYVCPGCYAVGGEPCAPGCIDDEIRRKRERPSDCDGFPEDYCEDE